MSGLLAPPSVVARSRTHLPAWVRVMRALGIGAVIAAFLVWEFVLPSAPRERSEPQARDKWAMGSELPVQSDLPSAGPSAPAPTSTKPSSVPPPVSAQGINPMGFWDDGGMNSAGPRALAAAAPGRRDTDVATPAPGSDYAQRMQTTAVGDTAPVPHHFHVQYTIRKGQVFPCLPIEPISSELPGPVGCMVTENVMSMDGSTILLPVGTLVNGQIEHGLTNGDTRLFLVWTDALTPKPDLLAIPLDAPAADEMGQVGLPGDLNEHLWRKLRATLLVSAIDVAGQVAVTAAQSGNHNNYFGNLGSNGNSLAEQALAHDLNIPTPLYRGASQPLTVYTNHYIDFWRFYQNRVVQ